MLVEGNQLSGERRVIWWQGREGGRRGRDGFKRSSWSVKWRGGGGVSRLSEERGTGCGWGGVLGSFRLGRGLVSCCRCWVALVGLGPGDGADDRVDGGVDGVDHGGETGWVGRVGWACARTKTPPLDESCFFGLCSELGSERASECGGGLDGLGAGRLGCGRAFVGSWSKERRGGRRRRTGGGAKGRAATRVLIRTASALFPVLDSWRPGDSRLRPFDSPASTTPTSWRALAQPLTRRPLTPVTRRSQVTAAWQTTRVSSDMFFSSPLVLTPGPLCAPLRAPPPSELPTPCNQANATCPPPHSLRWTEAATDGAKCSQAATPCPRTH